MLNIPIWRWFLFHIYIHLRVWKPSISSRLLFLISIDVQFVDQEEALLAPSVFRKERKLSVGELMKTIVRFVAYFSPQIRNNSPVGKNLNSRPWMCGDHFRGCWSHSGSCSSCPVNEAFAQMRENQIQIKHVVILIKVVHGHIGPHPLIYTDLIEKTYKQQLYKQSLNYCCKNLKLQAIFNTQ